VTDRQAAVGACALACLALALLIVIAARAPAAGAAHDILVSAPVPPAATVPDGPGAPCALAGGRGTVSFTGACRGAVGGFACVAVTDDLYLSARQPIDREHVLYVTVNVESYKHRAGEYAGVQAFLQVTGPAGVPTWSDRGFTARVGADDSVTLGTQVLTADPGTGAAGPVTMGGTARCAP
jgi:hypothetical protein